MSIQMALIPVGSADDVSITVDGTEETTETIDDEDTIEVLDYITNHGSETITGPNDTLSGEGYYFGISNGITDRGTLTINGPNDSGSSGYYNSIDNNITNHGSETITGPNDTLSGEGYYSDISNNITDHGSIGSLDPGESGSAGYYSGGTVNEAPRELTFVSGDDSFIRIFFGGSASDTLSVTLDDEGVIMGSIGPMTDNTASLSSNRSLSAWWDELPSGVSTRSVGDTRIVYGSELSADTYSCRVNIQDTGSYDRFGGVASLAAFEYV